MDAAGVVLDMDLARNPYGIAGVGAALLALAASWFPARRAARVDPIETLH